MNTSNPNPAQDIFVNPNEIVFDQGVLVPAAQQSAAGLPSACIDSNGLATAETALQQGIKRRPDASGGHYLLREGNAPQALQEYQEYLRLEPNGSMAPGVGQIIKKIEAALHP
jgi:hypothetical protein